MEIPAREQWLFNNPAALQQVKMGLEDAARGRVTQIEFFGTTVLKKFQRQLTEKKTNHYHYYRRAPLIYCFTPKKCLLFDQNLAEITCYQVD